jgi:glutamate racemase
VAIYEHATPELVPLVEAGRLSGAAVDATIRRALAPLLGSLAVNEAESSEQDESFVFPMTADARIDTLLLGCTHYPLLSGAIRDIVGEGTAVIDSASATASALASLIEVHALGAPHAGPGKHTMLTTGEVDVFRQTAVRLFGQDFGAIESMELSGVVGAVEIAP